MEGRVVVQDDRGLCRHIANRKRAGDKELQFFGAPQRWRCIIHIVLAIAVEVREA